MRPLGALENGKSPAKAGLFRQSEAPARGAFLLWQRYGKLIQCTALLEMHRRYSDVTPYRISAFCSRKFQKEMGTRLSDYIRDTRLEYAKIWLLSTEKTVQEISEQLQFCSRNYFSRVFREKEGMSPQELRDSAKVIRKVR